MEIKEILIGLKNRWGDLDLQEINHLFNNVFNGNKEQISTLFFGDYKSLVNLLSEKSNYRKEDIERIIKATSIMSFDKLKNFIDTEELTLEDILNEEAIFFMDKMFGVQ